MEPDVLIVDDEAAICEHLGTYLEDDGLRVRFAHSGEEAIRCISDGVRPAVCIMDLRLPGISGDLAVRDLHTRAPHLRFVIHTGSAPDLVISELQRLGLEHVPVFKKPIADMRALSRVVRELGGAA